MTLDVETLLKVEASTSTLRFPKTAPPVAFALTAVKLVETMTSRPCECTAPPAPRGADTLRKVEVLISVCIADEVLQMAPPLPAVARELMNVDDEMERSASEWIDPPAHNTFCVKRNAIQRPTS